VSHARFRLPFAPVAGRRRERTAAEQAERAIARLFIATRAGQLGFSTLMVVSDRRRFRRPKLQAALLAGTVVESAWLTYRLLRADRYQDRTALWVDTVWAAAGLMACEAGLGPGEGAPWMKNVVNGAFYGAAASESPMERAGTLGLLSVAVTAAGARARGRDSHVAGLALAVNDIISWTGAHVAGSIYVAAHRRQARLQDEADRLALEQATEAASEAERSHQHRLLHQRTVEVLRAVAASDDRHAAGALARHEAGRLRHILRTKGEVPTDLDSALYEVVEAAGSGGFHVELVTAELLADVAADVVVSVREAVDISLLSAREYAGAERAVVRAASEGEWVTVTIRTHAGGFSPGAGSPYEKRLSLLDQVAAPLGGRAEVWSAPDRGVRATLVVPALSSSGGQGARDESSQGIPHRGLGRDPAGHDDGAVGQGDVDRRTVGRLVGSPQDHVDGFGIVGDRHLGTRRQPLESGPQQRPAGEDANGRGWLHSSRMAARRAPVLVTNTPFSPTEERGWTDEASQAERTITTLFLSWRFSGLTTGLAALVAGRRRYRSQAAAGGQLLGAAVESAWLARRLAHAGWRFDRETKAVDLATAVSVLLAGRANLVAEDRSTWINWAQWSFAANAIAGRAFDEQAVSSGALGAAAIIAVDVALADRWTDGIVNAGGLAGCFAVGLVFVRQIRHAATRLEAARATALDEGRRLAVELERSRQLRLLHDSALQTLEAVGSGRYSDLASIQAEARNEIKRLEHELEGTMPPVRSLRGEIDTVVDEHTRQGLHVDLVWHGSSELPVPVVLALRHACNEALMNVRKHAGTLQAVVTIEPAHGGTRMTVRDDGEGFDPSLGTGFGTTQSIIERMAEVGGRAEIDSAPGGGTRVTLWGPS